MKTKIMLTVTWKVPDGNQTLVEDCLADFTGMLGAGSAWTNSFIFSGNEKPMK
jgi:hypothetical protein